ncbi:MAG: hypothetical protein ACRBBN_10275 [Methyloligellaceae bacterium]
MSELISNLKTSLTPKALWAAATVLIIINLGFGLVNGFLSSQNMKKQMTEQYTRIAEARARILAEPVWIFEYSRARTLLQELIVNSDILEAKINVDKETLSVSQKLKPSGETQTVSYPITFKDEAVEEKLGSLTMTFSTRNASSAMTQRVTESIFLSLILLLAMVFFSSRLKQVQQETV